MQVTNNRILAALVVAALATSGCLGLAPGDALEPQATRTNDGPAPTVFDMSGELPATSVGVHVGGSYLEIGTVPSGGDDNGTVLIDFQPDLGPAALSAWICIGSKSLGFRFGDCEAYAYSTGNAVQLDATGLSGKTILIGTGEGAGSGTTYVLCASVFDGHRPASDYTAIVDGRCKDAAAIQDPLNSGSVAVEHPVSMDLAVPFHVFYVYSHRCAVDFVEVDGPIINVDVTATWDYSVPVVGEELELMVYNGSTIPQDPHTRFPAGTPLAQEEGPSPLSLEADVAAGNQVGLVVCDWSHVVVRQGFDVHIEGSVLYRASAPEAT